MSQARARRGRALNSTTPDPRNGSTHLPPPSHAMLSRMNPTSLVFMPCVLRGGTSGADAAAGRFDGVAGSSRLGGIRPQAPTLRTSAPIPPAVKSMAQAAAPSRISRSLRAVACTGTPDGGLRARVAGRGQACRSATRTLRHTLAAPHPARATGRHMASEAGCSAPRPTPRAPARAAAAERPGKRTQGYYRAVRAGPA